MEMTITETQPTRALLVEADTGDYDAEASLNELFELAESAGAEPVASITQKLQHIDPATCVGSGKLDEIKDYCEREDIDLIIFDLELSPVQIRNIEAATDVRVIDRTMLILDIFALRARSREGKIQVELAQLKYMMPRLTGKGIEMSRLGGGIGTRGARDRPPSYQAQDGDPQGTAPRCGGAPQTAALPPQQGQRHHGRHRRLYQRG